jgi:hypothetical protein
VLPLVVKFVLTVAAWPPPPKTNAPLVRALELRIRVPLAAGKLMAAEPRAPVTGARVIVPVLALLNTMEGAVLPLVPRVRAPPVGRDTRLALEIVSASIVALLATRWMAFAVKVPSPRSPEVAYK